MASDDGGRTWRVLSRLGEADLHKIIVKHDRMYAYDAVTGALLVSRNRGRRIDGEPYRLKAVSRDELYLVIGDGAILHTRDGATTWEAAFTP